MIHLDDVLDPDFWEDKKPLVMDGHPELQAWSETQEELRSHLLFRTSGSSGTLKWIALSKSALWWSAERVVEHLKILNSVNIFPGGDVILTFIFIVNCFK